MGWVPVMLLCWESCIFLPLGTKIGHNKQAACSGLVLVSVGLHFPEAEDADTPFPKSLLDQEKLMLAGAEL